MNIREQIIAELDVALTRQIEAEDEHREASRASNAAMNKLSRIDDDARRLRLALFAFDGVDRHPGDANSENAKRRGELRRGVTND